MALEDLTGTKYLDDLVATNPAAGDNVSEGDDHIRGIKNVLKLTFPNVDAACNATPTEFNYVDGVTSAIQTQLDAKLPLAGGALTGAVTTNSTFDGIDIATRDGVLTSTTATAAAALPKAGGAMTGAITTNSTFDGIDIATRDGVLTSTTTTAAAALPKAGGTMTGEVVLDEITETEATNSGTTYTVDLANGTIFDLTSGSTCTVTMPAFEAGKSFTVISTVPSAWAGSPAIIWTGGAAPTTGSGRTIYSFVSDGARWYGMQAGTGFA